MKRTLLLNADARPIRAISWQRAIQLLWLEKAVMIVPYDEEVRSPSITMKRPAVIILRKYAPLRYKNGIRFSMKALMLRDNAQCQYCQISLSHRDATKDHVIPRDHFKKKKAKVSFPATSWQNVVLSCRKCNATKRNRTPREAGMSLIKTPNIPKKLRIVIANPPEEWEGYIE